MPVAEEWEYPGRSPSPDCMAELDVIRYGGEIECGKLALRVGEKRDGLTWMCTRPRGHVGIHVGHFGVGQVGARWTDEDCIEEEA